MTKRVRFPSIEQVAKELRRVNAFAEADDDNCDVRLQVYPDGDWVVRYGSADYDQDHRGFWGASSVPGNKQRFASRVTAKELLEQAKDMHAQDDV